jgi:multidrug efflux system outer membrane protein
VPPIIAPPTIVTPEMKNVQSPTFVNDLIANLLISYELDFWGKYYLKTQAAMHRAEGAEADLATARLLLADQIAATYFTIQAMEYELSLIRDEIEIQKERLSLLSKQCTSGLRDTFQLLDQHAALETKKKDEQALIQSRDINRSLLAVLVGREPNNASFDIEQASWFFPVVPPGIPSSLLAKRPDIRTNMKEVEAVIAEIGAAKADLLPSISLSAAAGYQAGVAHEWLKWKDRIWSIATSVSQPLFDAGQRFAQIDAAKARYREAASVLTQTVLSSVKEVEDALVAIQTQNERRTAALKREEDLGTATLLRADLCATGIQDYLIVLQTKETFLQARRDRINEEFNLQLGTLALMKSLGGSWTADSQNNPNLNEPVG